MVASSENLAGVVVNIATLTCLKSRRKQGSGHVCEGLAFRHTSEGLLTG